MTQTELSSYLIDKILDGEYKSRDVMRALYDVTEAVVQASGEPDFDTKKMLLTIKHYINTIILSKKYI